MAHAYLYTGTATAVAEASRARTGATEHVRSRGSGGRLNLILSRFTLYLLWGAQLLKTETARQDSLTSKNVVDRVKG
eukprot:5922202-Prymnesium_polylepis.3